MNMYLRTGLYIVCVCVCAVALVQVCGMTYLTHTRCSSKNEPAVGFWLWRKNVNWLVGLKHCSPMTIPNQFKHFCSMVFEALFHVQLFVEWLSPMTLASQWRGNHQWKWGGCDQVVLFQHFGKGADCWQISHGRNILIPHIEYIVVSLFYPDTETSRRTGNRAHKNWFLISLVLWRNAILLHTIMQTHGFHFFVVFAFCRSSS